MNALRKNQWVTYSPRGTLQRIQAKVRTAHRDGTCTVQSFFWLDETGKTEGMFIGYHYRMDSSRLTPAEDRS